jgi:hypothetical protein
MVTLNFKFYKVYKTVSVSYREVFSPCTYVNSSSKSKLLLAEEPERASTIGAKPLDILNVPRRGLNVSPSIEPIIRIPNVTQNVPMRRNSTSSSINDRITTTLPTTSGDDSSDSDWNGDHENEKALFVVMKSEPEEEPTASKAEKTTVASGLSDFEEILKTSTAEWESKIDEFRQIFF